MVLEIAQYTVQPAQAEAFHTAMLTGGMPIIRRAEGCRSVHAAPADRESAGLHSDHRVGDAGASYGDVSAAQASPSTAATSARLDDVPI